MAALCGRCARELQLLRISWHTSLRSLSTAAKPSSATVNNEGTESPSSKQRDPMAVLNALASTVKPNMFLPNPEFIEDMFLLPRSRVKQEECLKAKQSGREAANFVINQFPWIFPIRKPNPEWPCEDKHFDPESVQTEEALKFFIKEKDAKTAVLCYEKLQLQGDEVSLETQNQLLDLAAQLLGNISAEEAVTPVKKEEELKLGSQDAEGTDQEEQQEGKDSDTATESSDQEETEEMASWREDNYAETMFRSMATKDGRTYEAFILGLLKHKQFVKAYEMFDEMRTNEHQASVFTYNLLLHAVMWSEEIDPKTEMVEKLIKNMNEEPVVPPDLRTYNVLLRIAVKGYEGSPASKNAFGLIRDMFAVGIEPSLESYNQLLRAEYLYYWDLKVKTRRNEGQVTEQRQQTITASSAVLEQVISYVESLPKLPELQDREDVYFFHTAMSAAYLCRNAKLAVRIYELSEKDTNSRYLGEKRASFYSSFLLALIYGQTNPATVYEYYKELVPTIFRPRDYVYSALFNMAYRTNNPAIVPRLYEDMKKHRVSLTTKVADAMFKALGRAQGSQAVNQNLALMLDVLRWMNVFQINVTPVILSQLIRMYCMAGKLEDAWKTLRSFPTKTIPPYAALVNILSAAQQQQDHQKVITTFEIMAKFGYNMNMNRRLQIYDAAGLPNNERKRIDWLFRDMAVLDKRRSRAEQDEDFDTQ